MKINTYNLIDLYYKTLTSMQRKHRIEVTEATVDHAFWDFFHLNDLTHLTLVGNKSLYFR